MVVDARVEAQVIRGKEWWPASDPTSRARNLGPWAVPHATEIARALWRRAKRRGIVAVRVIDTAGTVVEQWPKRPRVTLLAEHPDYLITGVMADP